MPVRNVGDNGGGEEEEEKVTAEADSEPEAPLVPVFGVVVYPRKFGEVSWSSICIGIGVLPGI